MAIPAVDSTAEKTVAAQKRLTTTYDDFLKLLTTQLTNQDPTAPMDTTQMVAQIASLSQVEQQINMNNSLMEMISMFNTSQTSSAVAYIGAQIDAPGDDISLISSQGAMVYDLPAAAKEVKVTIKNASGNVVFSGDGTKLAGRNQLVWNGDNSITGNKMDDGAYTYTIEAKDMNGEKMEVTTYTSGVVGAVQSEGGVTKLVLGNSILVPMADVRAVYPIGTNPGV